VTTERVIDRRTVLKAGALAAGAAAAPMLWARAGARGAAPRARLTDVEHVVILMQENRSFDHYFGTLRGVRGFSDPHAVRSVFRQFDPDLVQNPQGYVLPYRFDTTTTSGQSAHDLSHAWSAQHYSWNNGLMDGFVAAHRLADDIIDRIPPIPVSDYGPLTMGYFTRADIPFHYALADAFTICDGYHCSVFGPTNPNRIMAISGTIDAEGAKGGPCIDNSQSNGQLRWTTYPERLHAAGISWRFYQEADNDTNNMLPFFRAYTNASQISRRANTVIPTPHGQRYGPALAARLKADVLAGELPQVSWILASSADCEHPSATPGYGARFVASILDALTADPRVWAKTAVFYTFDENDGFFDHVTPPTPPPGTAGEYLPTSKLLSDFQSTLGWTGPVGLGFRVPMIVMSPWTRGGRCCSDVFDHTSILLFLEKRFGVEVPNISAWRRATVGDLTEAFNFAGGADPSLPKLPDANHLAHEADLQASRPPPRIPSRQIIPAQELGPPRPKPRE
jgi:phospholipase C